MAAVAAAVAALVVYTAAARRDFESAFDRLHEAREYFYPVETRLLDLTLLAHGTLGDACARPPGRVPAYARSRCR